MKNEAFFSGDIEFFELSWGKCHSSKKKNKT